jgi:hypothetical protein
VKDVANFLTKAAMSKDILRLHQKVGLLGVEKEQVRSPLVYTVGIR